jgi:hypothetical protein
MSENFGKRRHINMAMRYKELLAAYVRQTQGLETSSTPAVTVGHDVLDFS